MDPNCCGSGCRNCGTAVVPHPRLSCLGEDRLRSVLEEVLTKQLGILCGSLQREVRQELHDLRKDLHREVLESFHTETETREGLVHPLSPDAPDEHAERSAGTAEWPQRPLLNYGSTRALFQDEDDSDDAVRARKVRGLETLHRTAAKMGTVALSVKKMSAFGPSTITHMHKKQGPGNLHEPPGHVTESSSPTVCSDAWGDAQVQDAHTDPPELGKTMSTPSGPISTPSGRKVGKMTKKIIPKRLLNRFAPPEASFGDDGPEEIPPDMSLHQSWLFRVVTGFRFEYTICACVLANSLTIGIQTDIVARQYGAPAPAPLQLIELVFCLVFTGELLVRLYVHRLTFFGRRGWEWNVFDLVVVGLQLLEMVVEWALSGSILGGNTNSTPVNFTFMRVFRLFRLIRIVRLARLLRHIRELRTLVTSIICSLKALVWTILLLLLVMYTISIFITQQVADHRYEYSAQEEVGDFQVLATHFGNLPQSMISLFEAITGGQDWDVIFSPLRSHLSPHVPFVFLMYISFTVLAMMNVVTGVFVESVLESTKRDKELFLINNVKELFQDLDGGLSAVMSVQVFKSKITSMQMQEAFKAINVDPSEAHRLFQLIDLDSSGGVTAEEFLSGCLRLRGPAKALDLALLYRRIQEIETNISTVREGLSSRCTNDLS